MKRFKSDQNFSYQFIFYFAYLIETKYIYRNEIINAKDNGTYMYGIITTLVKKLYNVRFQYF